MKIGCFFYVKFVMVYRLNLHLGKIVRLDYDRTIKLINIKKCKDLLKKRLRTTLHSAKVRSV